MIVAFDVLSNVLFVGACASVKPRIALAGAVSPPCNCAFRFGTTVVLPMTRGAVPVLTVLVIGCEKEFCPVRVLFPLVVMGNVNVRSWPVTPVAVMLTL